MKPYCCTIELSSASETRLFAQVLSLKLRAGDVVALNGDLGAGKTTLAREMIRAIAGDGKLDVPSPTYSLAQNYVTQRFEVRHYDFYRLAHADELVELGLTDDLDEVVSIIEWPDRAAAALPAQRIEIELGDIRFGEVDGRTVELTADGAAAARMTRAMEIWFFLRSWFSQQGLVDDEIQIWYMQGDASARSYARLQMPGRDVILMDSPRQPDGPLIRNGLPYSRIAHLAEDIRPFIAIGAQLERHGYSVPATHALDAESGLAVIEDLGARVFGDLIANGHDIEPLYRRALDVLVRLAKHDPPFAVEGHACAHIMPRFDQATIEIEIELLLDWYVPFCKGQPVTDDERASFLAVWRCQSALLERQSSWILRDFHSPNLIWLPDREGAACIGIIDYQDAVVGHRAYDVVSLLQDARLDVPEKTEQQLLDYYLASIKSADPDFDEGGFQHAYAFFGAQRNTKILGIFARLAKRDGKSQYLRHIPRLCSYLQRCLGHPELQEIRAWFAVHLPNVLENGE